MGPGGPTPAAGTVVAPAPGFALGSTVGFTFFWARFATSSFSFSANSEPSPSTWFSTGTPSPHILQYSDQLVVFPPVRLATSCSCSWSASSSKIEYCTSAQPISAYVAASTPSNQLYISSMLSEHC